MVARRTWLWISLGLLGLAAFAAPRAAASEDPNAPPIPLAEDANALRVLAAIPIDPNASRPAAQDDANLPRLAPRTLDLAAGAVDPLDLVEENVRFSVAAGEGKELDEAAFGANRERHNPFVRSFDRWESLLLFDRNGDGKISWQEAARYRRELRRQMLAAYDADRNGRLTGEERAAANKALAEGNLPALNAPRDKNRPEPVSPARPGGPASQPTEE